jgi:hypothetical protein
MNFWLESKLLPFHTILTHQIQCRHDRSLFQKPKTALKRKRFNDIAMIHANLWNATANFKTMHFRTCFKEWQNFWAHCIMFQGDYSEGHNIDYKASVVVTEK